MPLLKRVTAASSNGAGGGNETSNSNPLDLILSSGSTRNVLLNCVAPKAGQLSRKAREPSPDLIEIQAQIEAIR